MDFNIVSDPEWVRDNGKGKIIFKNFVVKVNIKPVNRNGHLEFEILHANMEVEDLDGVFTGQTEVIESVNLIMHSFKTFFREEITKIITLQLAKSVQATVNEKSRSMDSLIKFDDHIFINTSLTQSPIVKDNMISLAYDGSFSSDMSSD